MPALSASALRTQLNTGAAGPLYLLLGDDDAEKAEVAGAFADLVDPGLQAFNVDRLYGAETTVDALLDAANTFPMMAERRVVLVLEAERLLIPKRESKAADEELARLEAFIQSPSPHASVVFVCGSLDMRRRISKTLAREAQVVDCGTIEDSTDAERWIKARAARDKVPLDAAAIRALVDRGGTSLVRLRSGLERVALYAMGQAIISADDVRQSVPAGPEQHQDFGIADAIRQGDAGEALKQLNAALENGAAPFFLLGQLRFVAEKTPGSRLRDAVNAVFRTDLALKSSGGDQKLLLERLVVELCGGARQGDAGEALKQLNAALENGAAPFFLLGQLRFVAEKTPGPRLRDAVNAVFRTDLALKSSGGDQKLLLERLVVELCGGARQGGRPGAGPGRWAGRR